MRDGGRQTAQQLAGLNQQRHCMHAHTQTQQQHVWGARAPLRHTLTLRDPTPCLHIRMANDRACASSGEDWRVSGRKRYISPPADA